MERHPIRAVTRLAVWLSACILLVACTLLIAPVPAAADPAFRAFIEQLWPEAQAQGVSKATFDAAFKGVIPDPGLPDLILPGQPKAEPRGQAEFVRPPQDYLAPKLLDGLSGQGRQLLARHAQSLSLIEGKLGVDRHVILAIWGRETAYGNHKLGHYAIRALATQAYWGRRKDMFRAELIAALRMLEAGAITIPAMRSSWAGAMGLTQFMPTEYFSLAIDLDGDGKKDLWGSVADALGSAANQLKAKGWISGRPWGYEVRMPKEADCSLEGPPNMRPLGAWAKLGFSKVASQPFTATEAAWPAYLMMPAGAYGPAFLVTENFIAIRAYNTSDLYALFVGNLADRIGGGGAFKTAWANAVQIPTRDIVEIQSHLKDAGAPITKLDGFIGSNTRGEIGRYQKARGLAVDCWPTPALLAHLRAKR